MRRCSIILDSERIVGEASGSLTALRRLRTSRCSALTVCVPVQGLAQPLSPGPEPRRSPAGLWLPSAPGQRGGRTAPVRLDAGLGQQLRQTAPPRPASNARPAGECQSTRYVPCWGFRSRWHTRTYTSLSSSCSAARSGSARVRRRGTARSGNPAILHPTSVRLPGNIGAERPPIQACIQRVRPGREPGRAGAVA